MKLALLMGIGIAACTALYAQEAPTPPTLRHVNVVAINAPRGATVDLKVACVTHGAYQDWLKCRLVQPDGFVAASARVRLDEEGRLSAAVDWDGRCALEANSGWNLGRITFPEGLPHAYRSQVNSPLKTVGAWGPLFFHVPAGTPYFNVWIHASVTGEGLHFVIEDPEGNVAREEDGDFDERTKIQIQVPEGQDDAGWSIEISKPLGEGMGLDDVYVELGRHLPPFLAPRAEWAKAFAGDWRYDPDAPQPPTRFEPTEPTLPPFPGETGPEMDRAYSREVSEGWRTSLPFTYILDYGPKHLGNPEYVPAVATAPPALLHLGKDVPFNHGWGPIKALGGENQAYGTDEHIVRISPEQVAERIEGLREMVAGLHEGGVRWVTPYICGMTLDGDEQRRTGFWGFYDHWDEYLPLGLAARPKADPYEWLQRNPDGTPRKYYRYSGGYYPPFKTNHRYTACWRTEGWRTWLLEVVRFAARCGYDGVFVDNANSQRCQCPLCLAAFREHLKAGYSDAQARELFGAALDEVAWPEERNTPLDAEMNRYWCGTVREELAAIKATGSKELGREFVVFPNGGRPAYIQRALRDADFVMFEKSIGDYGTHPGLVLSPLFDGVTLRAHNDNIFEHKFVQCLRQRVRPIILSRPGYPRRLPWLMLNPECARLGFAECGAFSGGGGFLLRPDFGVYHDALNEYRRFFETHPQLYAALGSYAQVAVLAFPEQSWLGNRAHMGTVRALTNALTEAHVLFEYVSESRFSEEALRPYEAVVAADLRVLSDTQLQALARYVEGGGHLVMSGELAAQDETLAERGAGGEAAQLRAVGEGQTASLGRGKATRCAAVDDIPAALGEAAAALSCADERAAPQVKVNAFRTVGEGPQRLVVHVVNYNVPLGVNAPDPEAVDGVELSVPLPAGMEATAATGYAPDEPESATLPVRTADGQARVTLPPVRIYRVVELALS